MESSQGKVTVTAKDWFPCFDLRYSRLIDLIGRSVALSHQSNPHTAPRQAVNPVPHLTPGAGPHRSCYCWGLVELNESVRSITGSYLRHPIANERIRTWRRNRTPPAAVEGRVVAAPGPAPVGGLCARVESHNHLIQPQVYLKHLPPLPYLASDSPWGRWKELCQRKGARTAIITEVPTYRYCHPDRASAGPSPVHSKPDGIEASQTHPHSFEPHIPMYTLHTSGRWSWAPARSGSGRTGRASRPTRRWGALDSQRRRGGNCVVG